VLPARGTHFSVQLGARGAGVVAKQSRLHTSHQLVHQKEHFSVLVSVDLETLAWPVVGWIYEVQNDRNLCRKEVVFVQIIYRQELEGILDKDLPLRRVNCALVSINLIGRDEATSLAAFVRRDLFWIDHFDNRCFWE